MEAERLCYHSSVSSVRETREYLRKFGDRSVVVLRILAADSVGAAWSMRRLLVDHVTKDVDADRAWTLQGRDQLEAAADLKEPVFDAMGSSLLLLERFAGGFAYGPAVTLAHGAVPLPQANGGGPGGIAFGVFEHTHDFLQGDADLTLAYGEGGIPGSIANVLLRGVSAGLMFADEKEAVDAEGGLETLLACEQALRRTESAPLRGQAMALAKRIFSVRRAVREFGASFEDVRRLTRRRSRFCRVEWVAYYDKRFQALQEARLSVMQLLHELGVHLLRFESQRIEFPPPALG